jgi:hypothetical protein
MLGDRERAVQLNADHRGVCKFGPSQTDQDNFNLVRANIKGLYKKALENCELSTISPIIGQRGNVAQLAQLEGDDA